MGFPKQRQHDLHQWNQSPHDADEGRKVATAPNKRPRAEAKPSVRAQAKALLARTAIFVCDACVRNCLIFCPVVIVTYYELNYTGTCQERPGLCHDRQFVRCGA